MALGLILYMVSSGAPFFALLLNQLLPGLDNGIRIERDLDENKIED